MTARSLCLLLVAAACSSHSSSGTPVLASTTIGPEGGVLTIGSGPQAGLQLTVPPGALAVRTEVRIRDMSQVGAGHTQLVPHPGQLASFPLPGTPFRIEPEGLVLEGHATLRAPYDVGAVTETAPGNVRAEEVRGGQTIEHEPETVDVAHGFIELPITVFSQYTVVVGPVASTVNAYYQPPDIVVPLADGWTFAVEIVHPSSPSTFGITRWRITGPGHEDLLYFIVTANAPDAMSGRESATDDWRETWFPQSYPVWTPEAQHPQSATIPTQVQRPITAPAVSGSITVFGSWWWSDPQTIAGQLYLDVVTLRVTLAWVRDDLGVGQREYLFWFSPSVGLLGLAQDGLVHMRTAL